MLRSARIPEALFDEPATTEQEVEAVKALQLAAQQGQKIFTITQDNLIQVLPQLSHKATVIQDVKNAVAAGKIVTISQTMISYNGWTGTGYILLDPLTGAGAYLIGGGADGAFINGALLGSVITIETFIIDATIGAGVANAQLLAASAVLVAGFMLGFIVGTKIIAEKQEWGDLEWGCFWQGFFIGAGVSAAASSREFKLGKGNVSWAVASIIITAATISGWNGYLTVPKDCGL